MKKSLKRILTVVIAFVAVLMVLSFSACKKEDPAPSASASVTEEAEEKEKIKEEVKQEEKEEVKEEEPAEESISFSIGNDIGRNIVALQIKPEENTQWTDVALEKIWASGYMIPVTLTSEELPDDAEWEINVVFDDESEETFKDVIISEGADLILTPDEVVY